MRRGRLGAAVVALLAAACGGQVRTGEPSASQADPEAGVTAPAPSNPGGTVELPECHLGPEEAVSARCAYAAGGRCYDTKLDACACVCKKRSGTTCRDGFPDRHDTAQVTCS